MKKHLLLLIFISLFTGAGQSAFSQTHKPAAKTAQVTVIDYPCAVIIAPTSKQIAQLKKTTPAEDYNSIIDDNIYYQSEAGQFLDSVKIKQLNKYAHGILKFKSRNGVIYTIDLSKYFFATILFNGKTKPIAADMTMITDDYNRYMK